MNENEGRKRREWVKNAAIIFLIIMLLLTFFSNTIMNYSLPEVATQYVQSGSITAKVRGTGNVEANDPYNVIVKESRVISSVAVKQGDQVEKDQVLYYLEDAESDELKKAEDELEELELAYMKGLFGGTVSSDVINKVASGNTDSFATYQAMVTDMQSRLDAAEARVKECQDNLDKLSLQSTINSNNSSVNTIPYENEVTQSTTELENVQMEESEAQAAFESDKAEKIASLNSQIAEKQKQIADLEVLINGKSDAAQGNTGTSGSTTNDFETQKNNAEKAVLDALMAVESAAKSNNPAYDGIKYADYSKYDSTEVSTVISALENWIGENKKEYDYQALLATFYAAKTQLDTINAQQQGVIGEDNVSGLTKMKEELKALQSALNNVNATAYKSGESLQDAKNRLNQATQNLTDVKNANNQSNVSYQNQIANAEAALKNAQAVYDLLKTEQTDLAADINAELDLSKTSKDIAEKKAEIAKLKENSMGTAITAPVAGMVTNLAYVAGETTKPEETAAVIQVDGKGYTMTISVTNEQAKKVQVGDTAELQNAWYYDDVQAILTAIKPDPDNPGQKKLLEFDVTGSSIQAGQALNISVGQRSSEYELVVPNSAVREDNNGKFILIVESKSSPLGNRYIATRVDVEVLASDDNNSAISAGLYGYEYVITTSTKPVEAGKQVRLNE